MNEEQLSSPFYGPKQFLFVLIVWATVSVVVALSFVRTARTGASGTILFALLLVELVVTFVPIALILRTPHRVTLRDNVLRVYRGFGFTEIALTRVKYVEHDFTGRGPRRVILSIEPEASSERLLETVEFVPRGGELGLGGKEIADELRRKANEARAAQAAT